MSLGAKLDSVFHFSKNYIVWTERFIHKSLIINMVNMVYVNNIFVKKINYCNAACM